MTEIPDALAAGEVVRDRVERILRGEEIEAAAVVAAALPGAVPQYYGHRTPAEVAQLWLTMWRLMRPRDEVFYLAGAIYWAAQQG